MRNPKLVPYETIVRATSGEPEAIDEVCGTFGRLRSRAKELKEKAAALQSELSKTLEATANAEKFMKVVRKYTSFEELTPTLLREFVEKIVIHESEALDGKRRGKLRRQEIEIYYSFVGKVELPD